MSLENATNVAELVPTNPAGTDPVSDGDAHLRMIKTVMQNNAIKQMNGLHPAAAENHFWDGSVANQLTLKRGTPDAPGVDIISVVNGALSFPSQAQSLSGNGRVVLPGGLTIQWGIGNLISGSSSINYNTPFPNSVFSVQITADQDINGATGPGLSARMDGLSSFTAFNRWQVAVDVSWIAIGF